MLKLFESGATNNNGEATKKSINSLGEEKTAVSRNMQPPTIGTRKTNHLSFEHRKQAPTQKRK
jgi:hypothetical protein